MIRTARPSPGVQAARINWTFPPIQDPPFPAKHHMRARVVILADQEEAGRRLDRRVLVEEAPVRDRRDRDRCVPQDRPAERIEAPIPLGGDVGARPDDLDVVPPVVDHRRFPMRRPRPRPILRTRGVPLETIRALPLTADFERAGRRHPRPSDHLWGIGDRRDGPEQRIDEPDPRRSVQIHDAPAIRPEIPLTGADKVTSDHRVPPFGSVALVSAIQARPSGASRLSPRATSSARRLEQVISAH